MTLDLSEIPRRFPISTLVRTALKPFLSYEPDASISLFLSSFDCNLLGGNAKANHIVVFISDDLGRLDTSIHGSKGAFAQSVRQHAPAARTPFVNAMIYHYHWIFLPGGGAS